MKQFFPFKSAHRNVTSVTFLVGKYVTTVNYLKCSQRGTDGEGEAGGGQEAGGLPVRRHLPQHEPARAADQHAKAALPGDLDVSPPQLDQLSCPSTSQTRGAKRMRSSSLMITTCFSYPQRKSFTISQVVITKYLNCFRLSY